MMFSLPFFWSASIQIIAAIGTTVLVAVVSSIGAAALGFGWEIMRRSSPAVRTFVQFIIDFLRSTPILVQIYILYFVLPYYGIVLSAYLIGVLALSVYYSSYLSEVFKAGIDAIPRGQFEAAAALGVGSMQTMLLVIAPQMLRNIAAPMGNYFVSILKATPYLAVIAVPEMLGVALEIGADSFRYQEPMIAVGAIFLALALLIAYMVKILEHRLMISVKR